MSGAPIDLLRRLYVSGGVATLNDTGGIRLTGHTPPADVLDALKANRDAVAAALQAHSIGSVVDDGHNSPVPRRYVAPDSCLAPRLCARLGPCSRFLMLQPCDATEDGPA